MHFVLYHVRLRNMTTTRVHGENWGVVLIFSLLLDEMGSDFLDILGAMLLDLEFVAGFKDEPLFELLTSDLTFLVDRRLVPENSISKFAGSVLEHGRLS